MEYCELLGLGEKVGEVVRWSYAAQPSIQGSKMSELLFQDNAPGQRVRDGLGLDMGTTTCRITMSFWSAHGSPWLSKEACMDCFS